MGWCAWSMQRCGEWNGAFAQGMPSCSAFALVLSALVLSTLGQQLHHWNLCPCRAPIAVMGALPREMTLAVLHKWHTHLTDEVLQGLLSPWKPMNPVSCAVLRQCFFGRKFHVRLLPSFLWHGGRTGILCHLSQDFKLLCLVESQSWHPGLILLSGTQCNACFAEFTSLLSLYMNNFRGFKLKE